MYMLCVLLQDAVELLEKRVKSRFSHRQVTMFSDFKFEEYVALFTSLLSLPPNFYDKAYLRKWNEQLKVHTLFFLSLPFPPPPSLFNNGLFVHFL